MADLTQNIENLTAAQSTLLASLQTASDINLTIAAGKTPAINNSLTFAGTDSTTLTFPSTNATIARTDAANTFTGTQTFLSPIVAPAIAQGYATTVTSATPVVLTVSSSETQYFTGSTAQTVTLPVTSTLVLGQSFMIVNISTAAVTVQSSGANTVTILAASTWAEFTCILITGTTAASWNSQYEASNTASGKVSTVNNSLTLAGTDGTTITFPTTSATVARTDAANVFLGANTMAAGTATAGTAPIYLTSGTNLTAAAAGAIEYDGVSTYLTNETSSGRGLIMSRQFFMLTSDGGTISTIANFFGATSNPTLVSGGYYEIEAVMYFANSADTNTVTWTLTNSAAPTAQNIYFEMSPAAGVVAPPGTATALIGQFVADNTAAKAWNSGALGSAASYYSRIRMWIKNSTGTSLKIQMTKNTGGTATPKAGSWWTCVRLPVTNVGNFAA